MTDLPSDYDYDHDSFTTELTARVTSPSTHAGLSPAVRSVVTETLESASSSLAVPVALVRTTAATGDDDGGVARTDASSAPKSEHALTPTRATLLEISTSLTLLGGYARLRRDVLDDTRATDRDRDIAILASDYLHASAHATLAGVSIPTDRHVDLYRVLTAGSSTLATSFLERTGALECEFEHESESEPEPESPSNPHSYSFSYSDAHSHSAPTSTSTSTSTAASAEDRSHHTQQLTPTAVLAGTGSALGAAVAGSSRETIEAMRTYGESLVAAIDAVSGTETESVLEHGRGRDCGDDLEDETEHTEAADDPLLEAVERVLVGELGDVATGSSVESVLDSDGPRASVGFDTDTDITTHLERARSALEALPETAPRARLEAATLVPGMAVEPSR
ncbi:hypothetical protein [Natronoglomus mannanivorans]|uniref:Polyprenyl synthetase n=1 Tax=Natronoglomus mannanivorans TaxID=2979990 RepID=A0AAP3E3J5_9EURY|nr:hypothetical protein [Halobacteria archaeon AArc-xg1-1]